MPTDTAATEPLSGLAVERMIRCSRAHSMACARATQAPVIAAVRVPPSAWMTSQSTTMVFSPSALVSTTARRLRPINREISWVRPEILPRTDSRPVRSPVARGSMAYSAVTQPRFLPLSQRGTPWVKLAVHSTLVSPKRTMAEPSAWADQPVSMVTSRSWETLRSSARVNNPAPLDGVGDAGNGDGQLSIIRGASFLSGHQWIIPHRDVGQQQSAGPGGGGHFAGTFAGQVYPVNGIITALVECGFAEKQITAFGGFYQPRCGIGITRIGQHRRLVPGRGRFGGFYAQCIRLVNRMTDRVGRDGERADGHRLADLPIAEVKIWVHARVGVHPVGDSNPIGGALRPVYRNAPDVPAIGIPPDDDVEPTQIHEVIGM